MAAQLLQINTTCVPQIGRGYLGGLLKEPKETQHSVAAFVFCSVEYPDLLLKRKLKTKGPPEVQPEDFWQQTPNLGWEELYPLELCCGTSQSHPAGGIPAFSPAVLPMPWAIFRKVCSHVLKE